MAREGISSSITGAGLFVSLAFIAMMIVSIATSDRPWYSTKQSQSTTTYNWEGRQMYLDGVLIREESWEELNISSLQSLYSTTLGLCIAAIVMSFLCFLSFFCVGFFRWTYSWEDIHWANSEALSQAHNKHPNITVTGHSSSSSPNQLPVHLTPFKNLSLVRYFSTRPQFSRGLVLSESCALFFSICITTLLIAAVAVFSNHPHKLQQDAASQTELCYNPGPCFSFVGDANEGKQNWLPGPGWALALASLCLAHLLVFLAISQFFVRNNRSAAQDRQVLKSEFERAEDHGYLISDRALLIQSDIWQSQEKAYDKQWNQEQKISINDRENL